MKVLLDNTELQRGLRKVGQSIAAAGTRITAAGAGITAIGAGILTPLVKANAEFLKFGDQVDKVSARTGVSAESISALGFAAEQSGASLADVEKAIRGQERTILNFSRGLSTAKDTFSELNIQASELEGLNVEERFLLISDRLSAIEDPGRRAALAMQIFGKSGSQLGPLLWVQSQDANGKPLTGGKQSACVLLGNPMTCEEHDENDCACITKEEWDAKCAEIDSLKACICAMKEIMVASGDLTPAQETSLDENDCACITKEEWDAKCAEIDSLKACICAMKEIMVASGDLTPAQETSLDENCLCDEDPSTVLCDGCEMTDALQVAVKGLAPAPTPPFYQFTANNGDWLAPITPACIQAMIDAWAIGATWTRPDSVGDPCHWEGRIIVTCQLEKTTQGFPGTEPVTLTLNVTYGLDVAGGNILFSSTSAGFAYSLTDQDGNQWSGSNGPASDTYGFQAVSMPCDETEEDLSDNGITSDVFDFSNATLCVI